MIPSVTFATSCWEKDWRQILLDPSYLKTKQIEHHEFPFLVRVLNMREGLLWSFHRTTPFASAQCDGRSQRHYRPRRSDCGCRLRSRKHSNRTWCSNCYLAPTRAPPPAIPLDWIQRNTSTTINSFFQFVMSMFFISQKKARIT